MKHLAFIASCAACIVLGTLLPLTHTHAQTAPPPRMFYELTLLKSEPDQDPFKMERELWKPLP